MAAVASFASAHRFDEAITRETDTRGILGEQLDRKSRFNRPTTGKNGNTNFWDLVVGVRFPVEVCVAGLVSIIQIELVDHDTKADTDDDIRRTSQNRSSLNHSQLLHTHSWTGSTDSHSSCD